MKTLIIGSKGMLGQELMKVFGNDHEVIGWDRGEIDITEAQSVKSKVQSLRPELVINAAAYNNVDQAETETELANKINGYAVGNLAVICKELDIPLVHYSTDYVFDGTKKEGYRETDQPDPQSAYARSKYLGEQELQKKSDKYYLIRLSRLFGKEGGGKKSFVKQMIELSQTKKELDVIDEELSCPTYAPDLAERTKHIVENKLTYGVYHSANEGGVTWFGFATEAFKIKGIDVKLNPVPGSKFPRPAKRPAHSILLNTKLPPMRSWQSALKEFLT